MRMLLRIVGYVAGGLAALVVLLLAGIYGFSGRRFARTYGDLPAEHVAFSSNPEVVARGQHLVEAITKCGECHGPDLGGQLFIDAGMLVGRAYAPNLTSGKGSAVASYGDADWERAIRHGVARDGRALKIMPSEDFVHLSDADLAAIVAYVRSLPPVERTVPRTVLGPLGRALYLAGQFPVLAAERIDQTASHSAAEPGVTAEYGRYLATVGGCTGCHGPGLSGGHIPGTPPAVPPSQNLTPAGIGTWTEADFFHALREGKRPDGSQINPFMPWTSARHMTDDEIRAVWLYLESVPARPSGNM